jgi:type II secretory pathway predicted ATPase ExeA
MARCLLEPFCAGESRAYVEGRLARAGATRPLFEPEALELLHRAARGRPRHLNRLADMALLLASSRGESTVDLRSVSIAEREAA